MTGSPGGRLCARDGVGATAAVGTSATANAVSNASARAAGVVRRTLIVLPASVMFVWNRLSPMFSQTSGAPQGGQRKQRSRVVAQPAAPERVRSGRMRQQRGRAQNTAWESP